MDTVNNNVNNTDNERVTVDNETIQEKQEKETIVKSQDNNIQDNDNKQDTNNNDNDILRLKKELEDYKKKIEEIKKKELEEQKKYKELYEQTLQELNTMKERQKKEKFENALRAAAVKAGFIDPNDIHIANLSEVKLLDNGKLNGIDGIIEKLRKEKPYLFKKENNIDDATGTLNNDLNNINLNNWDKLTKEQREALLKEAAKRIKI